MVFIWKRFVPRSVAAWCLVAIAAGLLAGWIFGAGCSVLEPLGQVLIRAYSLVILPYLMLEVVCTFGGDAEGVFDSTSSAGRCGAGGYGADRECRGGAFAFDAPAAGVFADF